MSDPRYDPRFQRGWDGELPPPAVSPAFAPLPVAQTGAPPPLAPAPGASAPAAHPPAAPPRSDPPDPSGPPARPLTVAPAGPEVVAAPDEETAPPRNPYRVALVVIGAVLTAGAGGLLWQLAQPTTSSDAAAFVLPQLESLIAPWVLLAGLIALVAGIAVGAARRR